MLTDSTRLLLTGYTMTSERSFVEAFGSIVKHTSVHYNVAIFATAISATIVTSIIRMFRIFNYSMSIDGASDLNH